MRRIVSLIKLFLRGKVVEQMSINQIWVPVTHVFVEVGCACNHRYRVADEQDCCDRVLADELKE